MKVTFFKKLISLLMCLTLLISYSSIHNIGHCFDFDSCISKVPKDHYHTEMYAYCMERKMKAENIPYFIIENVGYNSLYSVIVSTLKPEGIKKLVDFLKFPNHTEMIELGKNISKIRTEESKKNTIISLSLSALVGIITGVASWFKLNKEKPKSDIQIKNNQEQQIKELNSKTPIPAIQESVKSEDSIVNITESDDESSKLNDLKTKNSNLTKDKAKFYSNIIASFLIGTMGAFYSGMAFYLCLPDKSVALSKKYSGLHFSNYNKALATSHILTDLKDREWENTDSIIVTFDKKISKDYAFVNTRFAKKGFNYSEDEKADIGKTFEKLKENFTKIIYDYNNPKK